MGLSLYFHGFYDNHMKGEDMLEEIKARIPIETIWAPFYFTATKTWKHKRTGITLKHFSFALSNYEVVWTKVKSPGRMPKIFTSLLHR